MKAEPQQTQRELIHRAEAELREKLAEREVELRLREQLQRRVDLLESVATQDTLAELMHRMMLRVLAAQKPGAAQEAPSAAQQAEQAEAPGPAPAEQPPLQLEDLPLSLADFDEEVLQRVADMSLDDCIAMYTTFVKKTQFAVTHVKCHGQDSYMQQEMAGRVTRFGNLLVVLGFLVMPLMKRLLTMNFTTLREEEVPAGWWARVAQVIPVHAEFAALVQAGVACAQDSVSREVDSAGDVPQQLRQAIQSQEAAAADSGPEPSCLLDLSNLLEQFHRCANSVSLMRTMVGGYLVGGMMRMFDPVVSGEVFVSCWPYSVRLLVVFEEYWKRRDVQAAVQLNRDTLGAQAGQAGRTSDRQGQVSDSL